MDNEGTPEKKDNISRSSSKSNLEINNDLEIGVPCYKYIFTNECMHNTSIFLVGCTVATLITLSINNREEFLRIMKIPISDSLKFPLIPTVGLIIFGSIIVSGFICYIKQCKNNKEKTYEVNNLIKILERRNSLW